MKSLMFLSILTGLLSSTLSHAATDVCTFRLNGFSSVVGYDYACTGGLAIDSNKFSRNNATMVMSQFTKMALDKGFKIETSTSGQANVTIVFSKLKTDSSQ